MKLDQLIAQNLVGKKITHVNTWENRNFRN
jgi:hypothetical protein